MSTLNVIEFFSGDKQLDHVFKQTGWKVKTNAQVNLTYPSAGRTIKNLTFVMMIAYQVNETFLLCLRVILYFNLLMSGIVSS